MSVLVPLLLVVATGASSQIRTDTRSLERDASLVRFVESDGRVVEKSERGERRVLIELRARPSLDRKASGMDAEARRQREQLERDLAAIDTRVKARVPSRVTRRYQTLFSGVAAVVSAKSLAEIRRLPDVVVHDDVEVHAQLTESVPMIGAPTVWSSYGVTGVGVKVAVIDSGIDYTHPDLGGCFGGGCRVAGGHDFVNDDADPMDDNGHGTHVAGIVAANGTLKGVAPGATLLAYKALNANGDGFESDVIAALEQAVADGAKVANLSLGGPGNPNDALSQAVDNATAAGLLSVVAAGNSGNAYRTIDSPGVARTALTVGAIDKAGAITSFSSRGDVSDGVQSVMKPEIVAPGVAIRSTVPASGMHGDPSRYATLSGTSMATPHVAGAAALLLQWNAAQSPADLKNRLTASALASLGDPFTEGAGRVDLVPAFGLSILPSVAHVPLGVVTGSSGTVTIQKMFSLRNTSASAKTLTLAASRPFPAGTTLGIVPALVTLQAGESVDVTLTLQVDTAMTPEAPEPLAWSTSIAISVGGPTTNVPVYFFRGSLLTLTFDEVPLRVTLLNPLQNLVRYVSDPPGASFSTLLQSGTWDVLVHFRTIYGAPIPIVVREELSVQNQRSLSIERVDANRALTVQPVDHDQQPLNASDGTTDMMLALRDPLSPDRIWFLTALGSSTLEDLRLSSLSSRYLVGIIAGAPAPLARYYIYNWSGVGLNQDVVLPDAGTPMRRLSQAAPSFPSATLIAYTGFTVKMREATVTMQLGNGNFHPAWSDGWTFYRQTTSAFGPPVIFSHQTNLTSLSDVINGPFLRYDGGDEIQADRLPYFNIFDPSRASDAILGAAVERWDVDAPPNGLPLRFQNSTSFVHAIAESFEGPAWLTSTLGSIQTASGAAPQFTLSRGGVPVTTLPLPQLFDLISSPAGPHELRSASAYKIGNVAG
ncbi:MAG: S8 family peptidase, partial [Thermoanaerobaculia bacterium]